MEALTAFFSSVINATFDFAVLGEIFGGYIASITGNAELMGMWETFLAAIAPYTAIVPVVLIVISAVQLFFGKKIMPFVRFLACVVAGYAIGVVTVSPLINNIFPLPNYVSGIVIAIVAGVLAKFIYYIVLVVGTGYLTYMICFRAALLPAVTAYVQGNMIASAIVAAIAIVLVLLLRKPLEMAATSFIGAYYISEVVILSYINYPALIPFDPNIVKYVAVGVVALVGFIVQFKTRTRY